MAEEISMLKKFRRRFILMTMILVGIVALVAFAFVGITYYQNAKNEVTASLNRGVQRSLVDIVIGSSSTSSDSTSQGDDDSKSEDKSSSDTDSSNKKRPLRFNPVCSVFIPLTGGIKVVGDSITLDDDTRKQAVQEALQKYLSGAYSDNGSLQELSDFKLYYKVSDVGVGYLVAFVPTSALWDDVWQWAPPLVAIWILLMVALLVITFFLSRYVARPVERAWKDQQRFIADASHELKTPLTVIMADVSILKDSPEKTVREQSNWVEGISNEAERMKQLTEDLLTLAQADAGVDMKQIMGDVDFSSVVEGQVLQFDAVAFERGLVIQDDVEESLHVTGDQMRLENMVKTLLENACKYAEQPSSIDVKLGRDHGNAVLKIHNEGDPIPAEDLPHLFDRFYRSDKARTHEGEAASFGLGLSIAKSTAELHKGDIAVDSNAGGTTFTVRIPLSKAQK